MLPKSYLVFKWTVYALATLALFALQDLLLDQIRVWGVAPFLYPILPAVVASYEGSRRGPVFALCLGVVCDLLLTGPFEGFFTIIFPVIAIFSALIAENLLAPGWLCGLVVSGLGLLLTAGARILSLLLAGGGYPVLMLRIAVIETVISLPALLAALPLYRVIHKRCASDY